MKKAKKLREERSKEMEEDMKEGRKEGRENQASEEGRRQEEEPRLQCILWLHSILFYSLIFYQIMQLLYQKKRYRTPHKWIFFCQFNYTFFLIRLCHEGERTNWFYQLQYSPCFAPEVQIQVQMWKMQEERKWYLWMRRNADEKDGLKKEAEKKFFDGMILIAVERIWEKLLREGWRCKWERWCTILHYTKLQCATQHTPLHYNTPNDTKKHKKTQHNTTQYNTTLYLVLIHKWCDTWQKMK